MSSAWLLPEHLADVLPHEARRIEELRRMFLDAARCSGFELVMPPMLEHLGALLTGTGSELDLKTFKLVDQLSGRTLGLRADITPQVARIDAHLLNRVGVTRLCYCGPVLHTTPSGPRATREPLQFGAEIYGHAGLEADLEVLELGLDGLEAAQVKALTLDLGDARIVRSVLADAALGAEAQAELVDALNLPGLRGEALAAGLLARTGGNPLFVLETLKQEKLVLDWRKRQQSRAAVKVAIEEILDRLPQSYSSALYERKCQAVYQHVYDSYYGQGRSIYAQAS